MDSETVERPGDAVVAEEGEDGTARHLVREYTRASHHCRWQQERVQVVLNI
jgi:hypothetical protein